MGFTTYITPAPAPQPTLLERIAALSGANKTAILAAYEIDKTPDVLKHEIAVKKDLIVAINKGVDEIRVLTKAIIREEIVLVEGVYDPVTGDVITEPVYLEAPETIAELKAQVALNFTEIFTSAQVGSIIDKMIAWSEVNASGAPIGTAAVWAVEVVK
ncbi:unnamed protein product [marine sediment metagenome]|uniref:Uncharacterized protein n=1 Tax=marine sediment metagenome TaxID=412755 RepID=X0X2Q0_9ZZZZ